MLEDLEREFYAKVHEVETLRKKGIRTKEEHEKVLALEKVLFKLEEDMECIMTIEDME